MLTLTDARSGRVWGPVPLLELEVYSKAEFRSETVREYRIDRVEELDDGFHVLVGDAARGVRVGLWFRLVDDELAVQMQLSEVYEDSFATYRLFSVVLLPGLMAVAGAGSRMLLPLNSGVLCLPANKERLRDRFMIYGEQSRWELLPMLPVCGVQDDVSGLVALARQGAEETECHVATDGKGGGSVGFGFSLRQFWPDPVEKATREIRFRRLDASDSLVVAAAKRVRRHVIEDHGKLTLKQRMAESPELAALVQSYTMKLFYAVENRGGMMQGEAKGDPITFRQVMNFAEAGAGLERLKAAGIDHIHTQSTGFNPSGHDGMWPSRFPIDERLGGERGFRELIERGKRLGYTMNVHDNQLSAYRRSHDYREAEVVIDQWGQPMALGEWGGGPTFILNTFARPAGQVEAEMRALKALGLNGCAYLDGMGNPLYRDYSPAHPMTRTDYARATNALTETARAVYGAAQTECGFLYCAIAADALCTGGTPWHLSLCWPEWPVTALMDKRVPVWHLALHDLVLLENHGLDRPSTLECVLLGGHPRDEWSTHPGVMAVLNDARVVQLKAKYDLCLTRFGHLQTEEMLTWDEPADGVQRTTYADGTEVVADFNAQDLWVNGERINL
ncbi:MAG: hypothetical protein K8T26_11200 [Lentisphaerae bacterium]|nr:hypothetical protein [Lentisphaerota bacterium]